MRAAWIAVGTELLGTDRLDTNALSATALLRRHGVELRRKAVVGDHEGDLEGELRSLLGAYELVLVSGGLGPTAAHATPEARGRAGGRDLGVGPAGGPNTEEKSPRIGRRMPEVNARQAQRIAGGELLANSRGTAPGQRLEGGGTKLLLV